MGKLPGMKRVAWSIGLVMLVGGGDAALAGSGERDQHWRALQQTYYDMNVVEYCGLATDEIGDGFQRKIRHLQRWIAVPAAIDFRLRVAAAARADFVYEDYGLNGYRKWCQAEGNAAAERFLAFRARDLTTEAPGD